MNLITINEESGYDEKDEDVPEEVTLAKKKKKKNHIKGILGGGMWLAQSVEHETDVGIVS